MSMTGERRRRVWRWAVIVWVLAVAVAGGLTLWLQDSTEPQGPYVWENAKPDKTPDLPPCPTPDGAGLPIACAYVEAR
ncbi:hypothetical protein [Streptomyces sp. NPDC050416]|uniref:hypothetical protein n=1 Tax=Streptomyces sp. NPDC050416 TaxID=3365611 RepID=UPI0037A048D7